MRIRHNISSKPEEETFTYALLLARVSMRKIPLDMVLIFINNLQPTEHDIAIHLALYFTGIAYRA